MMIRAKETQKYKCRFGEQQQRGKSRLITSIDAHSPFYYIIIKRFSQTSTSQWSHKVGRDTYMTYLFREFNNPGVAVDVGGVDTGEPCAPGKLFELPLVPLLAACCVHEHDHVA